MIWNSRAAVAAGAALLMVVGLGLADAQPAATPQTPAPAAPTQTTESAQAFLKGTLARGDSTILMVDPRDQGNYGPGAAVITQVESIPVFDTARQRTMSCHTTLYTNRAPRPDRGCGEFFRRIDWTKVRSAGRVPASTAPGVSAVGITGVFYGNGVESCNGPFDMIVIIVPSEETANKVSRAMNFLKENCNPAAGTGFE